MKTNPKSVRGEDGRFVSTGYDDKAWKANWHQENKERRNKESREYYHTNREILLKQQKKYSRKPETVAKRRQTQLMTKDGIVRGLKKRPYPGHCEMCKKTAPRLSYHHWDDSRMSMGIWLCSNCHWFVEGYEKGANLKTYLTLKTQLESQY